VSISFSYCKIDIMTIRPAKSEDIPSLVRLVNSAYRGEDGQAGWTNEVHLIGGPRTSEADVAELMEEQGTMVLTCWSGEGELAGCVYLAVEGDRLYLGMLSVRPDRRNGALSCGRPVWHAEATAGAGGAGEKNLRGGWGVGVDGESGGLGGTVPAALEAQA
jgi:hypothetical protein